MTASEVGDFCRQDCTTDCGHCKGRPGVVGLPRECRRWSRSRRTWVAKVRYGTRAEAATAVVTDFNLQPYRCGSCDWWHVGHPKTPK